MAKIYISAGSNQGNCFEFLQLAAQLLEPTVHIIRTSHLYLTEPWGYKEQPDFLNLVWEAETNLQPEALLRFFKEIEQQRIGRMKTLRYGPRVIDLDILLYDDLVFVSNDLEIPHKQIRERRFVLQPLCDLIPDGIDPVTKKTWKQLLEEAPQDRINLLNTEFNAERPIIRFGLRTYCMGIINLTPDSFSGDGLITAKANPIDNILSQCQDFLDAGVDILDIGAQSTRPGFKPITTREELKRLCNPLKIIRGTFPHAILSIDTGKASVLEQALEIGVDWINNTGRPDNQELNRLCAISGKPTIVMRSKPLFEKETDPLYPEQIIERARIQLIDLTNLMVQAGVKREKIILDPGIGFGSSASCDRTLISRLDEIRNLGYPLLVGASRKSFIGTYLNKEVNERLSGTAAVVCGAIFNGADIIRVHDVKFMKELITMCDLITKNVR